MRIEDPELAVSWGLIVSMLLAVVGVPNSVAAANANPEESALVASQRPEVQPDASLPAEPGSDPCADFDAQNPSWLDRTQVGLYQSVCVTAAWFDGFFGDARYDRRTGQTYGRLSLGGLWDERDAFDPKIKFRARLALPALRENGNFFLGRGNEQQIIEGRQVGQRDELAPVAQQRDNDSTVAGFGFSRDKSLERGFDLDLGVKVRLPPEPFVKASYRYGVQLSQNNLLRFLPVAYWRLEEKFGATLGIDLDYVISDSMLLRWANSGNVSQDREVEGVAWGSSVTLFQAMSQRRAIVYSLFSRGESDADVNLQNYGYEMRYRQRILRRWLFIEYLGSISWPREFANERRETNLGVGLRFEAYFGPAPDDWVR